MSRSLALSLTALLLLGAGATWWRVAAPDPASARPAAHEALSATPFGWSAQVTAIAGDGQAGLRDGAPGQARFADPFGLAIDAAGTLYVADAGDNNRIRRIGADGSVTTLAGAGEGFADGAGTAAAFHTPSGLALDASGNLYVADTGNHVIRKVTPQGLVSTLAGNGRPGYRDGPARDAQFDGPLDVAVDAHGNVFVADTYNDRIRKIGPDGQVSTLAGGDRPGYQDGPAAQALFDTPCALALDGRGQLFIADTRNNAIRVLAPNGMVRTLAASHPEQRDALLRRPVGIALSADGYVYAGNTAHGRIVQIAPDGELRGLSGIGVDFASGDERALRLARPSAIVLDRRGALYLADALNRQVLRVAPQGAGPPRGWSDAPAPPAPAGPAAVFPWPIAPQRARHDVVGTMGEVRGNYEGERRDHFHGGVDVQANLGTPVLAIADEKVSSPLAAGGFGALGEGLSVDAMRYIHMRVGRAANDAPLDPARFQILYDERGKAARVRVRRGTRFRVGDPLGTVNQMYHVHLEYSPAGAQHNPMALSFPGFSDQVAPVIDGIALRTRDGRTLGGKRRGRLRVARADGPLEIVVEAYDQNDGNAKRRRLGLYRVGYQILGADGTPLPGFERPLVNLEFNRLPPDEDSVKIAYAEGSGITVHNSPVTRFLYAVTNSVRDGHARSGHWDTAALAPGDYVVRIFAADYAGNEAIRGRDLPITVE